ncbi:MAG: DoxX family protein [Nanoarchaeota archaeon]|nr:DoxX family protein [Nanoarchaeota archaeon]
MAGVFLFSAFGKLSGNPMMVQMFETIGVGQWFRYFTGLLELLGAIGLLVPSLVGLASIGLAGIMVGAITTHFTILQDGLVFLAPTTLLALLIITTYKFFPDFLKSKVKGGI